MVLFNKSCISMVLFDISWICMVLFNMSCNHIISFDISCKGSDKILRWFIRLWMWSNFRRLWPGERTKVFLDVLVDHIKPENLQHEDLSNFILIQGILSLEAFQAKAKGSSSATQRNAKASPASILHTRKLTDPMGNNLTRKTWVQCLICTCMECRIGPHMMIIVPLAWWGWVKGQGGGFWDQIVRIPWIVVDFFFLGGYAIILTLVYQGVGD